MINYEKAVKNLDTKILSALATGGSGMHHLEIKLRRQVWWSLCRASQVVGESLHL